MGTNGIHHVAGIFASQSDADAAQHALQRIGVATTDVEIGTPEPGRYRVEDDESRKYGRGVTVGILLGVPAGGGVAIGVLRYAVPDLGIPLTVGLGMLIGGYWGIFFGGLAGMVPKVLAHAKIDPLCTVADGCSEVVVIAYVAGEVGRVRQVMKRHGARSFLQDAPLLRHDEAPLALAS
jgi:hypothetical protein